MNDSPFTVHSCVTLSRPADVLTAIPYLLGFVPDNCLVVLALGRDRLAVTARLDLPTLDEVPEAAGCLTNGLAHTPTRQLVLVGYGPEADVVPVLGLLADCLLWPVLEAMRVEGDRWWSLTCEDPGCCPPGAPLVPNDRVVAALLVVAGSPAASRADRAATLVADPAVADDVTKALAATSAAPRLSREAVFTAARAAAEQRSDRRHPMDADQAAVLLRGLSDVTVRDACLAWADLGALNLWQDLLATAPSGWAAPAATLLAVTAYQRGDGALALLAIDRALDDEPGYRLALLVRELVATGLTPTEMTAVVQQALTENPLATGRAAGE